jgi:hypothetical protein
MLPLFEIFSAPEAVNIGARSPCPEHLDADRTCTPGNAVRAGPQSAVAVVLDHPSRQPCQAQCRRPEDRRPPGFVGVARQYHVGFVFLGAETGRPRRGQAACQPGFSRHPVSVRASDPREAGRLSRLQGRAILSIAHQGCRRRRFLHRLGRSRRGPDLVRLAGAGLRQGAWLDEGPPRRPHDRVGRRCRDGRGQHLRGTAGRLEARPA